MKDLDFDEIDRAVGGVVDPPSDDVPGSSPDDAPASPVVEDPPKDDVAVDFKPQNVSDEQIEPVESIPEPRIIPHRKGRFLDMVNNNANMKTNAPKMPPKVSHEAAEVEPEPEIHKIDDEPATPSVEESSDIEAITPAADAEESQITSYESEPAEEEKDEPELLAEGEKDDQIEAYSEDNEPEGLIEANTEDDQPADSAEAEPIEPVSADDEAEPTSSTPFLPDARVEKRPLGGGEPEPVKSTPDIHQAIAGLTAEPTAESAPVIVKSKGKSGWLWALLVLLLVALGAGIGFVVYLFFLQ